MSGEGSFLPNAGAVFPVAATDTGAGTVAPARSGELVLDRDPEADAWDWLDSQFLNVEAGQDPSDRTYGADEMVDAYMAGEARARAAVSDES